MEKVIINLDVDSIGSNTIKGSVYAYCLENGLSFEDVRGWVFCVWFNHIHPKLSPKDIDDDIDWLKNCEITARISPSTNEAEYF